MKAIVLHKYGSPDGSVYEDVEKPDWKADEILELICFISPITAWPLCQPSVTTPMITALADEIKIKEDDCGEGVLLAIERVEGPDLIVASSDGRLKNVAGESAQEPFTSVYSL